MGLRPTSPTRPLTPDQSDQQSDKVATKLGLLQKLHNFLGKDDTTYCLDPEEDLESILATEQKGPLNRRDCSARPVGVGLPRQTTFRRQNSERRERLCPAPTDPAERRTRSASRADHAAVARLRSTSSPPPYQAARCSAPAIGNTLAAQSSNAHSNGIPYTSGDHLKATTEDTGTPDSSRPPRPASVTSSNESYDRQRDELAERAQLNAELDTRWILNLSMHFRDKSDREKFFVTYAELPNKWRRVTVSVDYRNAEPGSLEMDLKELTFQRDKSLQIYEAIRDSLLEIQFYDTVTNLKLETSDGRLHVHVTEDVNEIIPYPPRNNIAHVLDYGAKRPMACRESDISFEAHLSGFVYKVKYKGRTLIKKEIPGPDTVDEFLYEVNALNALNDSQHVIHLEGVVLDDTYSVVKGLLISYAEKGAVVDLLYDHKGEISWERRERWARHAVAGLSEIHEEGYVQGDFTLSNIVVDARDNARIIDINRRGCPVGWEPPELAQKIANNQRISMYIGEKSDLYQLGMTLWALAMDDDEPERLDPPLSTQEFPTEVPEWYAQIVRICLSPRPRDRMSAKDLTSMFPNMENNLTYLPHVEPPSVRIRTEKRYIDPEAAVERDDLEKFRHDRNTSDTMMYSPESSRDDYTFTYPRSSNYDHDFDGTTSEFERPRGRRRVTNHDEFLRAQNDPHVAPPNEESESPPVISEIPRPSHLPDPEDEDAVGDGMDYFDQSWSRRRPRSQGEGEARHVSVGATTESADLTAGQISPHHVRALEDEHRFQSETSEATPKTSAINLALQSDASASNFSNVEQDDDLIGMGSHPNIRSDENATSELQPETSAKTYDESDGSIGYPPPRLRFVDSGFNEPSMFGLDIDVDEDVAVSTPKDALPTVDERASSEALETALMQEAKPDISGLVDKKSEIDTQDGRLLTRERSQEKVQSALEDVPSPLEITGKSAQSETVDKDSVKPLG